LTPSGISVLVGTNTYSINGTEWYRFLEDCRTVEKANKKQSIEAMTERREAVMQAAFEVFVEKGFEAATTLEIVRRAKTSKRTLYQLFDSKQAILTALIRSGSLRMETPQDLAPPNNRAEFLATLESFGRTFLAEFLHPDRMAMYRLAIAGRGRGQDAVARELTASGQVPVTQSLIRYFDQAATRGLFPRDQMATLIHVFFSVLIGFSPLQILLGNEPSMNAATIEARAALAVNTLRRLLPAE
jgi:AcrR family transcriptional regulator